MSLTCLSPDWSYLGLGFGFLGFAKAASRGDAEALRLAYPNHANYGRRMTEDHKPYAIRKKEARTQARAKR
jgi:hypothetical protein